MDSRLPRAVAAAVSRRADAAGMRVLLIRRAGRDSASDATRRWAVADAVTGRTAWRRWTTEDQLVDDRLPGDSDDDQITVDEPTYLVCTHGKHDVCCAMRGRPVAQALSTVRPRATWECSHVGGDRFAANVVVLPWGLYYGNVDAIEADELARLTDGGRLLVSRFRGRTGLPLAAQAAQQFIRRRSGIDGRDALGVESVEDLADDRWTVRLVGQPPLDVSRTRYDVPTSLTCSGPAPASLWRWSVGLSSSTA